MSTKSIAVFDVDETLINCKSMFCYLSFAYRHRYGVQGDDRYREAMATIQAAQQTMPREQVNRVFYRLFVGWRMDELQTTARSWFRSLDRQSIFIPETLNRFEAHVEAGDITVLLTGSASFIVAPIAEALSADIVLAINLETLQDGTTTGEIAGIQTIGEGKAEALTAYLQSLGLTKATFGYGDHESDLPFLKLCDRACCAVDAVNPMPQWAAGLMRLNVNYTALTPKPENFGLR